ncbi:DUF1549 domain-containing protein [Rubellicoccus peritrichatus]|uniref:DUF1549 domain-containing protein n=1 Tax=Rubellicoccus peritrichatus TaxID=3080537 RepID=A0AAQ3L5C2_9BACT|nr:DUF1549 domain-containing protein [Puniceicoccus sp. CR14]WOO39266.1 DUF1549 domain-containing protein [Puniceicoccus sp. CR14]
MRKTISRIAALALLAMTIAPSVTARIFTDIQGRTIDAELHSIMDDQVTFKRTSDGRAFTLPLSGFSIKDRNFILNEKKSGRLNLNEYTGFDQPTVTPVIKSPDHKKASKRIDDILAKYWKEQGVKPAARIDDATFLRRAYLKIIGRIPTHAEAVHFLNDNAPNKRVTLIDTLLDSPGYVSHNFNLWADVLRAKTTGNQGSRYGGVYYVPWIKEQIRENVPYDDFVKSLITAEGYPWENPATAYYLRDFGMPLDNMAMTTQIFLGTQLQCAQCHDHPTDVWTQKDFYEHSAFTYGLQTNINFQKEYPEISNLLKQINRRTNQQNNGKKLKGNVPSPARSARLLFEPLRWGVSHSNRDLKLPHDYQYDNGAPKEVVEPKILFGDLADGKIKDSESRVQSYANWMVGKNNERFTLVIANRMWKQAMGKGLIEPVDNLTEASEADIPELMTYLQELMQDLDYDMKQYLRVIYNTKYFQREAVIDNPDLADDYHLEGPVFQRMSAEQIWDSIATLITPDIDLILQENYSARNGNHTYASGKVPPALTYMEELSKTELIEYMDEAAVLEQKLNDARAKFYKMRNEPSYKGTPQLKEARDTMNKLNKEWRQIFNPESDAEREQHEMGMMSMMASMTPAPEGKKNKHADRMLKNVRRASELQSPQRNGHLLEVFGQSDRQLIENADSSSNVIQALFLMNSAQTNVLMAERSAPVLEARWAKTPEEKLETLYIGFLSRKPTQAEQDALLPYFKENPEKARQRIIWAMMNTQQFLFIQ